MPLPGQGKRIQQLILELAAALGKRVTLEDYGTYVGKAESGRGKPWSKGAVSEWIQDRNEPGVATFVAMAAVSRKHTPQKRSFTWIVLGTDEEDNVEVLPAVPAKSEAEKAAAKKPSRRRRPA